MASAKDPLTALLRDPNGWDILFERATSLLKTESNDVHGEDLERLLTTITMRSAATNDKDRQMAEQQAITYAQRVSRLLLSESLAQETVRFELRLPGDLHAEVVAAAEQGERSMNRQIVYLLRRALKIEM